jgi:hypothetical protein
VGSAGWGEGWEVRRSFFEKKEPKKLPTMGPGCRISPALTDKSFLVLFFKKGLLAFVFLSVW